MSFLNLPTEIIQHIAAFLPAKSLASFSQTCKQLNEVAKIDSLWQMLSKQDYQVSSNTGWNICYREIYTKVLYKLHGLLGLKRLALVPYGGLVHVCWADGEIQVNRYLANLEDRESLNLSYQQLFSLRWNESLQEIEVFCVQCPSGSRKAILAQTGKYPLLKCADADCNITHTLQELHYGQSDKRFQGHFDDHQGLFINFNLCEGFNCPMLPISLPTQAEQTGSPIQLGLYTGDYGSHGVEILNLTINQTNPLLLEALKIVGDPNVPAGNVSFTVFLDKPIVLSEEDQESVAEMLRADEERTEESFAGIINANNNNPDVLKQPFIVPEDCYDRGQETPNACLARYLGIGRIAFDLFVNPSHCKCHFIKFSDDKFGMMWLDLSTISLFSKVSNDFPLCSVKSSKK